MRGGVKQFGMSVTHAGPEVGVREVCSFFAEFGYFRQMTDRRSEQELGLS